MGQPLVERTYITHTPILRMNNTASNFTLAELLHQFPIDHMDFKLRKYDRFTSCNAPRTAYGEVLVLDLAAKRAWY